MIKLYDAVIRLGLLIFASAIALPFGDANKLAFRDFWFTCWLLTVCFAYLSICWRRGGMTVGMRAWKTHLVNENGKTISWAACLLRFVVSLVSVLVFGLGIIWALWDKRKRSWHDIAAKTVLIKDGK